MPCRSRFPSFVLLLAGASVLGAQQTNPSAAFDAYVKAAMHDWHPPGLAVAVVKDGRIVFAKGYGVRELGKPGAVDTSTLFAAGSTTKAMTAAAIGMLVDEGKIQWDAPVTKYLPAFKLADPLVTRELTVRDLLTHRSGLGNADYLWYESGLDRDAVVSRARLVRPAYSFRSGFIYQNVMYAVAGQVVAAVSGMSWDQFIRSRFFLPLGMTRSVTTLVEAAASENVAVPHYAWGPGWDTVRVIRNASVDAVAPAGSIWTSVADWSRWLQFLLDSGRVNGQALLKPATVAELLKPVNMVPPDGFYPTARLTRPHWTTYALGWFQQDYQGRMLDFHTGSIDGMVAIAAMMPDARFGVYILSNLDHAELRHALMLKAVDLWLGTPQGAPRDWSAEMLTLYKGLRFTGDSSRGVADSKRVTGTRPALALALYAGTYTDSLYGSATVTMDNGQLRLRWGTQSAVLEHWENEVFRARWDEAWKGTERVTFTVATGTAKALFIRGAKLNRVEASGLR